jgi:ribokinase/sulfofructose kinase
MKRYDLLALGDPVLDLRVSSEQLPRWDDKHLGRTARWVSGGSEANAACAAARLGLRCALLGQAGQGPAAALHREDLASHGVALEYLRSDDGVNGAVAVVYVSPTGERAITYVPASGGAMASQLQRTAEAVAQARLVYTLPYDPDALMAVAQLAQAHHSLLAVDVERAVLDRPGMYAALCQGPDLLCFNAAGFRSFSGCSAIDEAALRQALGQVRAQAVVVTLGADGSMAMDRRGPAVHQPALPAQVLDTTGAGDAFNGALLAAWLQGVPPQQALGRAAQVAARCVETDGPRSYLAGLGGPHPALQAAAAATDGPASALPQPKWSPQ